MARTQTPSKFASTIIVGSGSIFTLLVGLIAQAIIAARFAAGNAADAYFTALVVPGTLVNIFLLSLNLIFIPVFIETREHAGEESAWEVVSLLTTNLILLLILLSGALILLANPLVTLVFPGFDPPTQALTVRLVRMLAPIILFNALWTIGVSLLQAMNRFRSAVLGVAFGNLIYIIALFLLIRQIGIEGAAIAMAVNHVGALIGILFGLRDKLRFWRPSLGFHNQRFRRLLRLWSVLFSTSAFRRINPVIERYFASQTGVGSVSYLSYGNQMVRAIDQVFLHSVATVLFPSIAQDISTGNREQAKASLMLAVRLNAFIIIPVVFGLAVVREPVVRILLERGAFSAENTTQVSLALLFSSGLLINSMVGTVTSKALYSLKAVWFLAGLSIINVTGLVLLSILFIPAFGYLGIALANSLSITWPLQLWYLHRRLGPLGLTGLGKAFSRFTLLSATMAGAAYTCQRGLTSLIGQQDLIVLPATVLIGLGIYAAGSLLLRFPEAKLVEENVRRRLCHKPAKKLDPAEIEGFW